MKEICMERRRGAQGNREKRDVKENKDETKTC